MNILKLAFELFVIYIAYRFIFDFVIPVYRTTKQVQRKMNDMQQQRSQQNQGGQVNEQFRQNQSTSMAPKKPVHEDYIDYEEIK